MRAMILCAGKGKRMLPLTENTPKPLLKVAGVPIIAYHLKNLSRAKVKEVVINKGYLGQQLEDFLGNGHQYGVDIAYTFEDPILETGGGVKNALSLLGTDPFLVLSGDIITDFPVEKLLNTHVKNLAHFVLVDNPPHHLKGDYALMNGRVSKTGAALLNYGGISLFRPEFFEDSPTGFFPLGVLFEKWVPKLEVTGEYYQGLWHNIGTVSQFQHLNIAEDIIKYRNFLGFNSNS